MIYKSVYISFLLICLVWGFLLLLSFPPNTEQHFPPSHRPWGAFLVPPIVRLSHLLDWDRSLVCPLPSAPHPPHQSYFEGRQLTAPASPVMLTPRETLAELMGGLEILEWWPRGRTAGV